VVDRDVHLPEPAAELLAVAVAVIPDWMRRITVQAAAAGGVDATVSGDSLDAMIDAESNRLGEQLGQLLAADVDAQRTNPLSLFRSAVAAPTDWLCSIGVPTPSPDRFVAERFPDDVYGLGPATWADIDQRLHEPGLVWGAWKAMTVLRHRREDGLR
jgi:hypothetical protein